MQIKEEIEKLSSRITITEKHDSHIWQANNYRINLDNNFYYEWHDAAYSSYPEDLVWNNAIGELIINMIKLGIEIGRNEK